MKKLFSPDALLIVSPNRQGKVDKTHIYSSIKGNIQVKEDVVEDAVKAVTFNPISTLR